MDQLNVKLCHNVNVDQSKSINVMLSLVSYGQEYTTSHSYY